MLDKAKKPFDISFAICLGVLFLILSSAVWFIVYVESNGGTIQIQEENAYKQEIN